MALVAAVLMMIVLVTSVLAAVSDVRSLRIPNSYSIVVIVCFIGAFILSPDSFGRWWEHVGAFFGMLVITYLMFVAGMMGGGDSKFGSALALWTGLHGLLPYVFYMAIMGGIIGICSIIFRKYKPFKNPAAGSWMAEAQEGKNSVPYGIAITVGVWGSLLHTGFMDHQLDELVRIIH